MNPTIQPVTFQGGAALPAYGTEAYKQAQQGIVPSGFSTSPSAPITSSSLTQVTPYKLPQASPTTTASGIIGLTETGNKQVQSTLQAEQTARAEAAKTTVDTSRKSLTDTMSSILGIQSSRVQEEANANIPQLNKDLTDITNQIEARQVGLSRELENIEKTFQGSPQGLNDALRVAQRNGARELADLSIIQNARNRNLSTAQSLVDRKIELQLEPLKTQLEFQKLFYDENKSDFSKEEEKAFQLQIKESDRAYEEAKRNTQLLETTKLNVLNEAISNGADNQTLMNIQNATTPENALVAISRYGVNSQDKLLKDLQITKLRAETQKVLADTQFANDLASTNSPLVNAIVNVNGGSAEGQQKRDAAQIAQFVKEGKIEEAKNLILSRVTSKMSGTEREAEVDRRNTIDALTDIKSALNDYVAVSGDTNIIKGNLENVANKLGQTTDPRLAAIKTRLTQATQKYRNAITGAAWGEQETAEYKTIFPSITNSNKLNATIVDTMLPILQNNERNAIGLFLGGSNVYDSIFGAPQVTSSTSNATPVEVPVAIQNLRNKYEY